MYVMQMCITCTKRGSCTSFMQSEHEFAVLLHTKFTQQCVATALSSGYVQDPVIVADKAGKHSAEIHPNAFEL